MATGTSFNTSTVNYTDAPNYCSFTWEYEQGTAVENKTTIDWTLRLGANRNGYVWLYNRSVTIYDQTGASIASQIVTSRRRYTTTGGVGQVIMTGTAAIPHNNDGTGSVRFVVSVGMTSNSKKSTADRTFTLPAIPRASTISLNKDTLVLGSAGLTAIATSREDYYHDLSWTLNGNTTTVYSAERINKTSKSSAILASSLLAALNNTTSGVLTVTLTTYADAAKTTQIGDAQTATCAVSIDTEQYAPTVSNVSIAKYGSMVLVPVAGFDGLMIEASVKKSTSATDAVVTCTLSNGVTMTSPNPITVTSSDTQTVAFQTDIMPASTIYKTVTVTVTVVSRGISASASQTVGISGYTAPEITASFYRVVSDADPTEDESGAYAYGTFSAEVTCLANQENSIQSVVCTYDGSASGDYVSGGTPVYIGESGKTTFSVTATDSLSSVTQVYTISTSLFPLDLIQNGTSVGAAFGGVAEYNKVKTYGLSIDSASSIWGGDASSTTERDLGLRTPHGNIYMFYNANGRGMFGTSAGRMLYIPSTNDILQLGTSSFDVEVLGDLTVDGSLTINGQSTSSTSAVTRPSGGSISSQKSYKGLNTVTIHLTLAGSGTAVQSGYLLFSGTVAEGWRPNQTVNAVCYQGTTPIEFQLTSAGALTARNKSTSSVTIATSTTYSVSLTFVI